MMLAQSAAQGSLLLQLCCTQAESDHHIRDAYNYMTVQTDVAMPARQIRVVQDNVRQAAWAAAISDAVQGIRGQDMDCRVLDLGAGVGKSNTLLSTMSGCNMPCCALHCVALMWLQCKVASM